MHLSSASRTLGITAGLALAAACSAFDRGDMVVRPHVKQSGPPSPGPGGGIRSPANDTATTASPGRETLVRRVCRVTGWPANWVATAYESAAGECPLATGSDSTGVAAVIVRLDVQPVGATLDVCADQAVPRGWVPVTLNGAEISHRCPGAGPDGGSAVRRIRRMR